MYNRYLNAEGFEEYFEPLPQQAPEPPPSQQQSAVPPPQPAEQPRRGSLLGSLGDKLKLPTLDSDTILLLVLVYFLISDSDEGEDKKNNIVDTLLIVGALVLLGF